MRQYRQINFEIAEKNKREQLNTRPNKANSSYVLMIQQWYAGYTFLKFRSMHEENMKFFILPWCNFCFKIHFLSSSSENYN